MHREDGIFREGCLKFIHYLGTNLLQVSVSDTVVFPFSEQDDVVPFFLSLTDGFNIRLSYDDGKRYPYP